MRRFTVGLAIVLALSLLLAAVAVAAPPDFCDVNSDHWKCSTTTSPATTTTTEPSTLDACPTEPILIEVSKAGPVNYECLWTPENPGTEPLLGTVKVAPLDGISSLLVFVRDDSPGDICLLAQGAENQTEPDGSFVGSFNLAYGTMDDIVEGAGWDPQEYPDDERPPGFESYVGETYWTFGGAHWCYPQDGIASMRQDLNGEPLHLWVKFRADPKATSEVWVTLTPAQEAGS